MRKINSQCKKCRREGVKLFLKGERCQSPKCAMVKRNYLPGVHGPKKSMSKTSTYGKQLREKQKAKRIYGMLEKQFANLVKKAMKDKGNSGNAMLSLLELRFDNIIYKLHLSDSRNQAKQLISHGHFKVNGRAMNISSATLKVGDKIEIKANKIKDAYWEKISKSIAGASKNLAPWLSLDAKTMSAQIVGAPEVEDLDQSINTALIIEFYSR